MLIPYPFPLRPDLTVVLGLPDDLTGREIERLQRFIGTLGRPDPTCVGSPPDAPGSPRRPATPPDGMNPKAYQPPAQRDGYRPEDISVDETQWHGTPFARGPGGRPPGPNPEDAKNPRP